MLHRRTVFTGLGAAPLLAYSTVPAWPTASLTVATFNIWHNLGDWPARLPLLVEALRAADADVIALQEILPTPTRDCRTRRKPWRGC